MTFSIRKLALSLAAVVAVGAASPALAEGGSLHPRSGGFSFEGPFGTFDQGQLQRGYKVYREVCAACHSMDLMHFRTMGEKGGPFYDPHAENPAQNRFVRALAAEIEVPDIDTETSEAIMRPATPADKFPNPYPNRTAASAAKHNHVWLQLDLLGRPVLGDNHRRNQEHDPRVAARGREVLEQGGVQRPLSARVLNIHDRAFARHRDGF